MSVGFSALFYLMNYNSIKTHRCVNVMLYQDQKLFFYHSETRNTTGNAAPVTQKVLVNSP